MEIQSLSLYASLASTSSSSDRLAVAAMRKVLDASEAEGAAIIQLLEAVPTPSEVHQVDVYA
jgi:hypothetical protein